MRICSAMLTDNLVDSTKSTTEFHGFGYWLNVCWPWAKICICSSDNLNLDFLFFPLHVMCLIVLHILALFAYPRANVLL